MTSPSKAKGDRAEREAAELLTRLLDRPVRRYLGAGRADDVGDLEGVPGWAVQVADWKDTSRAALVKSIDAQLQAANSGTPHGAAMVRFRGGEFRIVLTPMEFAAVVRALEGARLDA